MFHETMWPKESIYFSDHMTLFREQMMMRRKYALLLLIIKQGFFLSKFLKNILLENPARVYHPPKDLNAKEM